MDTVLQLGAAVLLDLAVVLLLFALAVRFGPRER